MLQTLNLSLCYLSQMLYLIFPSTYRVLCITCNPNIPRLSILQQLPHRFQNKIKCLSRAQHSSTDGALLHTLLSDLHAASSSHHAFTWCSRGWNVSFSLLLNLHSTYLSTVLDSINFSQNPSSTWCLLYMPFCTLNILPIQLSQYLSVYTTTP